jgi:hypothetical protein
MVFSNASPAQLSPPFVMPALVAGIHVLRHRRSKDADGRNKSGHDDRHDSM